MQLEWTPWALPGMAGTAVAWSAAVVLLRTAPSRPLNRRLAAVLFAEGLWQAGFLLYLSEDPRVAMGFSAVAVGAMASIPFPVPNFTRSPRARRPRDRRRGDPVPPHVHR